MLFIVHPTQLTKRVYRSVQDVQSKRGGECADGSRYTP